jgi:hypothetical protein
VPSVTKRAGYTEEVTHASARAGHHAACGPGFGKYRNGNHQCTICGGVRADVAPNDWASKCVCGSTQSGSERAHFMIRHGCRQRNGGDGTRRDACHSSNIADIARQRLACHQVHGRSRRKVSTSNHLVRGNQYAMTHQFHKRHVIAGRHQYLGSTARRKVCVVFTNLCNEVRLTHDGCLPC